MFNWVDFLVILALLYFIWQGLETGFFGGLLNFLSTVSSLLISIYYYPNFGDLISKLIGLGSNIAQIISFFGLFSLLVN